MKTSTLVIALSLAANAALVAWIGVKAPALLSMGAFGPAPASLAPPAAHVSAPASVGADSKRSKDFLYGGDVRSVVARLKAAGFPYLLVREIARAKIDEMFLERRRKIAEKIKPRPYWKANFSGLDPSVETDLNKLNKEEDGMMNELFTQDDLIDSDPVITALSQVNNGGLTREDMKHIQKISTDYSDMKEEIYKSANGFLTPEDYQKLAYLQKEEEADTAKLLGPDQFLDYQLRSSGTAGMLRNSLEAFNPSEDEFRALFKIQQDFDAQYGSPDYLSSSEMQAARASHQTELLEKVQAALGPDRFAAYKAQTEPGYVAVDQLMQRLDMPASATPEVVGLQSAYQKQADTIRADSSLTPAAKTAQLSALADEATAKLTGVLGEKGIAAYKQGVGGWLQGLKSGPK